MITKIFAVYDSKAACYGVPFFMPKEGMALRGFTQLVNDSSTMVGQHPQDFSLFMIGEFNDETGECKSVLPVNLGTAASYKTYTEPIKLGKIYDVNGNKEEVKA